MSIEKQDERVDINFESHPPIEDDLNGIAALLRQTLLQFVDCHSLARYLIQRGDVTQVIVQEEPDQDDTSQDKEPDDDTDDEPDNDIYGVCSIVDLPTAEVTGKGSQDDFYECRKQLLKLIEDKCPSFKERLETTQDAKIGFIVNERYINLPPQLSLPTFKTLTQSLCDANYTHLVFILKVLHKSRNTDTKLPSKRSKSGQSSASEAEPLVFVNAEEEIISEESEGFTDLDVSAHCDENATWSFASDVKYIPHRRFIVLETKDWPSIMKKLEKELEA